MGLSKEEIRKHYKDPVLGVNLELFSRLTLEDNTIRPLPGATQTVLCAPDGRLSHLGHKPTTRTVSFYEHLATVRAREAGPNRKFDKFFVAFRQTMDALLLEQSDPEKYPLWLMDSQVKKTELRVHIYLVKALPKNVVNLQTHEDWLDHVSDELTFATIAYFLLKNRVISEEMYGRMQ